MKSQLSYLYIYIKEVAGGWIRTQDVEHHNFHASPNIMRMNKVKEDEMGGECSTHGRNEKWYTIFIRKLEGKRPLVRPRRRWEDTIRLDRREIGWEVVDWIILAQDRDQWRAVVSTVMNLRVR
jgi:hypothetical protein